MRNRLVILIAALTAIPVSAFAIPISGGLFIYGDFVPVAPNGSQTTLQNATGLDFLGDDFVVDGATGSFAAGGVSKGDSGVLNDFQFNPLTPAPVMLWAIAGFQFALHTVSIDFQSNSHLKLSGTGFLSGNGFDITRGLWSFDSGAAPGRFFFGSLTSSVPEPAALLIFGTGLLGLGLTASLRRRRSSARPLS